MHARKWRGCVTSAVVLAAALASGVSRSAEVKTALTPRMTAMRTVIAQMTDPTGIAKMELSPDGKHIAAIVWTGQASMLMLITSETGETRILNPSLRGRTNQPLRANWISNDSLAVDLDNGTCTVLGLDGRRGRVLGHHFFRMVAPSKPDEAPQWAVVGVRGFAHSKNIQRVNVVTGEEIDVPLGLPGDIVEVVFDRRGRLRAASTRETKWLKPGAKITNWYRHDETSPWQQIAQGSVTEDLWRPLGVPDDSDTLVVLSREGRDTWSMFDFDVATRRITSLRVGHPTEDLISAAEDTGQNIIRATTHGLKPTTYWFDTRWDHLQRSIDKALPDKVNILRGDPKGKVLVFSYSDRDPGRWMLLSTDTMTLSDIARSKPGIEPSAMQPMQTVSYATTDGLTIPAYLTLPDGTPPKPRPMVVYIHGGPIARDEWGWNLDVQLLAAAGYVVFQPQFRGSAGFGRKFEQAGYRQWGLAMQDDVSAGVRAMVDQGIADPARVCIYGSSYGGYAALWGLIKTPQLYRCGVSLAGVTDIGELFSDWSDVNSSEAGRESLRFAVGDINTMAAQFEAVSPEKHAAQIRVPVLLAHGTDDRRVPMGHSKRMASALKAARGSVETHWYDYEGHGLARIANIRNFNAALLDFLDRNIGPASPAAEAGAATAASAPN